MVMLAEHYDFIIGGDPDRDTIDLAILDAVTGRVHTQCSDAAGAVRGAPGWTGSTGSPAQPEPPLSIGSRSERFARSLPASGS
jgi:hypothetical protein